jgi:signal transduction histidine kinase
VGRHTVRVRITAAALAVVGTALVVAAVVLVVLLHRSRLAELDGQVRIRAGDVAALAQRGELPPVLASTGRDTVIQVVCGGRVVAQSPVIRGTTPLWTFEPGPGDPSLRTVEEQGRPYRVAAARVDTPGGPATVYAAASLTHITAMLDELEVLLTVVVPVLILLVGLTTWRLVGRTLEPVEAIRREVAEISATALDRRVPVPGTADEIDRLAGTMNEMLDRLEAANRRQRSFVADASHELRGPLAIIRAKLEAGLARPGSVDLSELAAGWLDEQARLERLVDDLLLLARLDEGIAVGSPGLVDLDELVLGEARDLRARAVVQVDAAGVSGGRVHGNREQLRRVVRNLLDNAEHHATGTVGVALRQVGDLVELTVSDDGPGIPPIERQRIFERFVRLDEARNRRGGGAGLGLSIVRDIVAAHGGTAEAADAERGARLVIRLPAAEPPAEEPPD